MIDMHIHTNNSDGTDTIEELLKKLFTGNIVKGIEMKCSYKKRTIEVLGYKINTKIMQEWLDDFYKDKKREDLQLKYFNLLYEKCMKMGLTLDNERSIKWNPSNDWASFVIYTEIKKHESNRNKVPEDLWETFSAFSRKYCNNPEHVLYIDKSQDYPSLKEAILAIKRAEGLVFMPHLYINKNEFINEIVNNYDIDGIECYYTDFTEEQTKYLLDLCDKNKLYKSGGSDYHGKNKPKISLAKGYGNLNISEEIIREWI